MTWAAHTRSMPGGRGGPDRFLTTVLMTDIVGSTDHAAELGDAAWRDLIAQHHAVVRAALKRHGGRELDTAGDGFFATFDAPANAVACALEIVDQVKQLGIEVRAGIHVGEVEQVGRKVGGISVPIASRIMSIAEPSEVLVSSTVRDLVTGSRLTFEDRGVRELKGVPGEWHMYAVGRPNSEPDESIDATAARERRASAVRRAAARPIWQRRPRLVAAGIVGLAIVVATAGLLVWKPWQGPALAGVKVDSIGVIDPDRNEFTGEIRVGTQPGGIVVADGYAWVTNTGADSISQIDVATREVINRDIAVGHAPKGIAAAAGSVWVANSGDRTVSRIAIDTSRGVGEPIEVGNGPTAIASIGNTLWVANATDSTVVSIDAATRVVGQPVGVGAGPIGLAVDDGGLWVASEDAASVTHLDPVTGVAAAAPVQLAARPTALALDPEIGLGDVRGWHDHAYRTIHKPNHGEHPHWREPVGNSGERFVDLGGRPEWCCLPHRHSNPHFAATINSDEHGHRLYGRGRRRPLVFCPAIRRKSPRRHSAHSQLVRRRGPLRHRSPFEPVFSLEPRAARGGRARRLPPRRRRGRLGIAGGSRLVEFPSRLTAD